MPRSSHIYMYALLLLTAAPARAGTVTDPAADYATANPPLHGDLGSFFEFHNDPKARDFGSSKAPGEFTRSLGVECGVLTDTAPVAQWIARPPPKGQVAGSIPARGTNSSSFGHTALKTKR